VFVLLAGFVLLVISILVEMSTKMRAETFFNPLPTRAHTLLVWVVSLINGYVLWRAFKGKTPPGRWAQTAYASVTREISVRVSALPRQLLAAV
jgi:hypothetical protein